MAAQTPQTTGDFTNKQFSEQEVANKVIEQYSEAGSSELMAQYASDVHAVSTFYAAGDDAGNGYPSWSVCVPAFTQRFA